jgi:hypothetical protein
MDANGRALNCEDGIVFADAALRAELKARHPAVVERIEARRNFVREELEIAIRDSILPLSSVSLMPPAFWLEAGRLLRGHDGGGQQACAEGSDLTRGLIRFREICVNSVD